jgi:uncharacterized membrane protein
MHLTQQGILVEKPRISTIDIIRGLVMVIMVLDHVRHFMHADAFQYEPTDLSRTTPFLFFTRFITHFCAPAFVLLAGMAVNISGKRKTKKELRTFLLTRGLWLIFLEVVIIRFSFFFNLYYDFTVLQVIWAIGAAMVAFGLLIQLKESVLLVFGLIILFGHNLTDLVSISATHAMYIPWTLLLKPGYIAINEQAGIQVMYPVIPWLGVLMLGYGLGKWYRKEYDVLRPTYLVITGSAMIFIFIVLRYFNVYGDPHPWTTQKDLTFTVLSFLNCEKYPPSLLFVCMTLGPLLLLLAALEKITVTFLKPLLIFGRVPLFFYILHFYLIHIVTLFLFMQKTGKSWSDLDFHITASFGGITPEGGYSLPYVYLAWISFVIVLYPLCIWYDRIKRSQVHWVVNYV